MTVISRDDRRDPRRAPLLALVGPAGDTALEHDHAFYAHADPRWLVCRCGQLAVRARTLVGQSTIRLIDPPAPVLQVDPTRQPDPRRTAG